MNQLIEKRAEFHLDIHLLLTNYIKAFDSVNHHL